LPNTGATPQNSFQNTYNDVQKSDQGEASNSTGDQKPLLGKPDKDRKDPRDSAPDPKDAPVIAEVTALLPPPIAPLLLFALPVMDVPPATNSSESKDGASLSPPPPTAISTDLVSAGLAQASLDTSTAETLDIPRLPSSANQQVANKDLAFAIRLLAKDPATVPQAPANPASGAQEIIEQTTQASSSPTSSVSDLPARTASQPVSNEIPIKAAEAPTWAEVPAAPAPAAVPVAAAPTAVPAALETPSVSASSAPAPNTSTSATDVNEQGAQTSRLPAGAPKLLNKDLSSTIRPVGRDAGTAQAAIAPKSQTAQPIESPKITLARQPAPNGPSKGNNGSGDTPADAASAQKPVDTNMPYTTVRDVALKANSEAGQNVVPKPLDTRIEALAPVAKAEPINPAPVNEISLRVNGPDQSSAAIRVVDRSGEIRVSVHASDPQLANTLRADVDQVRSHMTSRGWDAEVWTPQTTTTTATRESGNHGSAGPQDQGGSGGRRDGQGQNQSRQNPEDPGKQPAWMEEFEATVLKGGQ
jgi:hypothetical protein